MYLLVFVTFIIGLLSIYGQILSVQAARLAAAQTSLASAMSIWHSAAVSMAASILDTNPPGLVIPCSLTYTTPPSLATRCAAPTGSGSTTGTVTDAANTLNQIYNVKKSAAESVHLPADYNAAQYQFYSILYRDANNLPFVISFVPPSTLSTTNPAPGFVFLPPNGRMTSFTLNDLKRQLKVSGFQPYNYGTIQNTGLGTASTLLSASPMPSGTTTPLTVQYSIPASVPLANGAIAVISSPASF